MTTAIHGSEPWNMPPVLYHYTSLDVLTKIINHKKLWASNFRYLNDASESVHFLRMIEARITRLEEGADNTELTSLGELKRLVRMESTNAYITSFSAKRDDLSQWRGYCQPGLGVCIGFKSSAIISALDQFIIPADAHHIQSRRMTGLSLSKIQYIDTNFEDLDALIGIITAKQGTQPISEVANSIVNALSYLAPSYKNSSFKNEEEWRIVIPHQSDSQVKRTVHFRSGRSTLIPYIEIDVSGSDYLAEVIVGSSPNIELTVESVTEMLRQNGMNLATVAPSDVPYRHW